MRFFIFYIDKRALNYIEMDEDVREDDLNFNNFVERANSVLEISNLN